MYSRGEHLLVVGLVAADDFVGRERFRGLPCSSARGVPVIRIAEQATCRLRHRLVIAHGHEVAVLAVRHDFRKNDHIRAVRLRLFDGLQNFGDIAFQVAVRRVD